MPGISMKPSQGNYHYRSLRAPLVNVIFSYKQQKVQARVHKDFDVDFDALTSNTKLNILLYVCAEAQNAVKTENAVFDRAKIMSKHDFSEIRFKFKEKGSSCHMSQTYRSQPTSPHQAKWSPCYTSIDKSHTGCSI